MATVSSMVSDNSAAAVLASVRIECERMRCPARPVFEIVHGGQRPELVLIHGNRRLSFGLDALGAVYSAREAAQLAIRALHPIHNPPAPQVLGFVAAVIRGEHDEPEGN